jgi:hypothetical protein
MKFSVITVTYQDNLGLKNTLKSEIIYSLEMEFEKLLDFHIEIQ